LGTAGSEGWGGGKGAENADAGCGSAEMVAAPEYAPGGSDDWLAEYAIG